MIGPLRVASLGLLDRGSRPTEAIASEGLLGAAAVTQRPPGGAGQRRTRPYDREQPRRRHDDEQAVELLLRTAVEVLRWPL